MKQRIYELLVLEKAVWILLAILFTFVGTFLVIYRDMMTKPWMQPSSSASRTTRSVPDVVKRPN